MLNFIVVAKENPNQSVLDEKNLTCLSVESRPRHMSKQEFCFLSVCTVHGITR